MTALKILTLALWTAIGAVALGGCDVFLDRHARERPVIVEERRQVIVEQRPVIVEQRREIIVEPRPAPIIEVQVH